MTQTAKQFGIVFLGLIAAFSFFWYSEKTSASITMDQGAPSDAYKVYELFASSTAETTLATTTSATSTNIVAYADSSGRIINGAADVRGAKKVVVYFSQGGLTSANTGTSTFSVQTTRDGTNWQNYSMLITDTTNTNAQTLTRVSSVTLPGGVTGIHATTTVDYALDLTGGYQAIRCIALLTGSSEQGCAVGVTY